MKKLLLSLLSLTALGANGQRLVKPSIEKAAVTKIKFVQDKDNFNTNSVIKLNKKTRDAFPALLGSKENSGNSTYDLQTNGAMPRRIIMNGNNISVGWTYSAEVPNDKDAPFTDRGTGYAHYNGTSWSAAPTMRLEPTFRTGFGGLAVDGNGNEIYIPHNGTTNKMIMNRKTGSTWNSSEINTSFSMAALWPHVATSGNWIYMVASPSDSNTHTNGIRGGYFFSRSNDNGNTWINDMIPMPLVDSVGHYRGGGNSYSISAAGSHVAVLFGDMGSDLTVVKSDDYGATWTKKTIFDWPIDNYNFASTKPTDFNNDGTVDTLLTCDGSHSIVIDTNGEYHAAFPLVRVYKTGAGASPTGYNFFFSTLLGYYNSVADSVVSLDNSLSVLHDCEGDGTFGIGQNYTGENAGDPDAIYSSIGTLSMPSISIVPGTPNKILIAYTCIIDNDTTVDNGVNLLWFGSSNFEGQNYRDVFVVGSNDNGASFTFPVNVSRTAHFEEAFVSTPERVTGTYLPMIYQGDIEPGTLLQNDDLYDPTISNLFIVQKIDIADIFTLGADTIGICNQQEIPLGTKDVISQNDGLISVFPNPTTDLVNLGMKFINTASNVEVKMTDIAGNVVYSTKLETVKETIVPISTKSFASGMYIINVTSDKGVISKKFSKE